MEEFFKCLMDIRDSLQRLEKRMEEAPRVTQEIVRPRETAVSIEEICELFKCSRETVVRNLRRADSPAMKTGEGARGEWRVIPSEYEAFLKKLAVSSKSN